MVVFFALINARFLSLEAIMGVIEQAHGPEVFGLLRVKSQRSNPSEERIAWLHAQLIGKDLEFDTPFGKRSLTYADHTASGRSLHYIENYILQQVLPVYGTSLVDLIWFGLVWFG